MSGTTGRPRQTSLDDIIDAAVEDGLVTFTMPSIGQRLGIAPSGIYRYARSRDHLLELALRRIITHAFWPSPALPWREQLTAVGETYWQMCGSHAGCAAAMRAVPSIVYHLGGALEPNAQGLIDQGLTMDETWAAIELVSSLAVNSVLLAEQHIDPGDRRARYQHNIGLYLDGLAARLDHVSRVS